MPVYYNDGLDDSVVYDRQASFVGGQVSNFRENLLNESQAELLKDVDAPKNGVLKSRRGFHRFANLLGSTSNSTNVQGIAYFDTDAKEALIVFVNGKIYSINSSGTVSDIASAAVKVNSLDARVYTAQSADKLFYTSHNGNNRIGQIEWDTSSSAFVVTEFPAAPTNSKYIISNNFRAFACQPSDDQIYVSDILAPAAHGTPPFPAGNAFKVGLGDPVTGLASWVGFNVVVFCKNSCYVVDTAPVPAQGGATTPAASTFKIRTISASTGCVAHGSIAQVGEDLFFLSRTGVRSIRRTMEENMVASDVGVISYPIQDVVDKINWAKVENATAVFWNNRYLLSVPTGTSEVNDTTLCYNTNTSSWTGVWQGKITDNLFDSGVKTSQINPYQFVVTQFSAGKPYLINLDKVGNPLQFRDFVEDINLVDTDFMDFSTTSYVLTEWEVITRAFTFNEQVTTKDGEFVEFEFDRSNAELDIGIILDGAEEQNLATNLVTGTGNLKLDFTLPATLGSPLLKRFRYSLTQYPEFRELQFSFRETTGATSSSRYLALRSIHAGGFLNSVGVES
jgi:hypothetical protein